MKNKIITASKYTAKIAVFLVLLAVLNRGLAYLVVDDINSYMRVRMHEFYEIEELDVLFLGSSHVMNGSDAPLLNELSSETTFNIGTGGQRIDISYALLVDYMKTSTVEKVYFEMYYGVMDRTGYDTSSSAQVGFVQAATIYMPMSLNKINLLLNASSPEYYINSFVVAKRYWKELFYVSDWIELCIEKQGENYKDFVVQGDTSEYLGYGFIAKYASLEEYEEVDPIDFSEYIPSEDWLQTFETMYQYCQENDIELILYTMPIPVETLASGDYDIYVEQVYSLIEGKDLTYTDFNLATEELLITEPSDFMDDDHLNYYGAEKFTEAFYQVYYVLENPEDYFYDTFREKLEDLYPEYLEKTQETA